MGGIGSVLGSLNPLKTPKAVTSSTLDPTSQKAIGDALTAVQGINAKGYTPYTGQKVAPLSTNENTAINNPVNTGVASTYFNPAADLAKTSATAYTGSYDPNAVGYDKVSTDMWNSGAAQQYMNPYVSSTLSPILDQIRRSSALTQNNIGARAASRNAFGGAGKDRLEIANNRDTGTQIANSTNQVYSDAYGTGLQAFLADMQRKLSADTSNQNAWVETGKFNEGQRQNAVTVNAGIVDQNDKNARGAAETLGTLGNDKVALHQANLDDLLKTGALVTSNKQAQDTSNYQDFLDSIAQAPGGQKYVDNLLNIVAAGKGGQQLVDTSKNLGTNKGAEAIGLASTVASIFSDFRLKENINHVGEKNGFNLYDFNYIGNPVRYRGVMAQEVADVRPDAVTEIGGFLAVNYGAIGLEMVRV